MSAAFQVEGSAHSAGSDGGHVGLGASVAREAAASAPAKERQAVPLLKRPSPGFRERHREKGREKTAAKEKEQEVDVEKDASKRGFANKMSGMLAAASSSLRSGPAKKERGSMSRYGFPCSPLGAAQDLGYEPAHAAVLASRLLHAESGNEI